MAPAMPHAVSACANREPPTSRVISARIGSDAVAKTIAGMRSATTVSPNTAIAPRASSGVRGGWSTYPHAGGSRRKYSSSR